MKKVEQSAKRDKKVALKDFSFEKEIWEAKKQKLREKFPELTDEDLSMEVGKENGVIEKIHSKIGRTIGKTKAGLHKFIKAL